MCVDVHGEESMRVDVIKTRVVPERTLAVYLGNNK